MAIEDVATQIKTHCPCFQDTEDSELLVIAKELINLLSSSACWSQNLCETLLTSLRTERIELRCRDCGSCCQQIERFRPYYQYGINPDSLVVTILTENGLSLTKEILDTTEYAVSDINGYTEFLVDVGEYAPRCGCEPCGKTYIEFTYEAGFEELPDCLFPEVCDLIKTITASKLGCGSLSDCCEMTQAELGYHLKSKKIGELSWTWGKDTDSIEYLYMQLVAANRFKTLGMISLCGTGTDDYRDSIWAVSVKAC